MRVLATRSKFVVMVCDSSMPDVLRQEVWAQSLKGRIVYPITNFSFGLHKALFPADVVERLERNLVATHEDALKICDHVLFLNLHDYMSDFMETMLVMAQAFDKQISFLGVNDLPSMTKPHLLAPYDGELEECFLGLDKLWHATRSIDRCSDFLGDVVVDIKIPNCKCERT